MGTVDNISYLQMHEPANAKAPTHILFEEKRCEGRPETQAL